MSRLVVLAAVAWSAALAAATDPVPRADALDLLLLSGDKPGRLEIRVEIDGKQVRPRGVGRDVRQAAGVPRPRRRRVARQGRGGPVALGVRPAPGVVGQFTPFAGHALPFTDLDLNADGKVGGEELADFYRRAGLGGVLVAVGRPTATDQLTDALVKGLDANKYGKADGSEWKAAAEALSKLDRNDDELIGPGELVEKAAYPGALGAVLIGAPVPGVASEPVLDGLPFVVLPLRTGDANWVAAVAAWRERAKTTPIPADTLAALRTAPPATAWQVRLGAWNKDTPPLNETDGKSPANAWLGLNAGAIHLELRTDDGKLAGQTAAARKRFAALFAECDANSDQTLDDKELGAPKAGQFEQLAAIVGTDGKLGEKQLVSWLDLQVQVAKGHVLLSVLDHGPGLFEFLDADHDGSLSVRELRTAWDRLKSAGCVHGGMFDRVKLPRQLLAAVSRGHPQTSLGKPVRGGPEWFRAMDRNGDGDVSRKEFTGPANVFNLLDLDKDGLLSPEEAEKADVKK